MPKIKTMEDNDYMNKTICKHGKRLTAMFLLVALVLSMFSMSTSLFTVYLVYHFDLGMWRLKQTALAYGQAIAGRGFGERAACRSESCAESETAEPFGAVIDFEQHVATIFRIE